MNLRDRAFHIRRVIREFFEDQWFDRTRHVRTSGDVSLSRAGISGEGAADSEHYVPARPAHIREALRAAPVPDGAGYTYVDLGSGKGRTLFVAAELPFRAIVGVELSDRLHGRACANIGSFRFRGRRGGPIRSIHANAAEFLFPEGPLVVYLFNPFGAATMQRVLDNLERSLDQQPRHVVVVLLWPRCGDQVARVRGMRLVSTEARYQIFEAYPELGGR